MNRQVKNPRVLVVTPEVTFVPRGMGPGSRAISARAGGLGDLCTAQIHALFEAGVDVHLAMPNYRNVFKINAHHMPGVDLHRRVRDLPESRIHLAQTGPFSTIRSCFYPPTGRPFARPWHFSAR